MVVKRRLLLAITAVRRRRAVRRRCPVLGAFSPSQPDPAGPGRPHPGPGRGRRRARPRDVGPVVAVGWREAAKPGELYVAFARDGGRSVPQAERHDAPVPGRSGIRHPRASRWTSAADASGWRTVVNYPGDDPDDKDVLLTSRRWRGQAGQAFLTDAAGNRTARQVLASPASATGCSPSPGSRPAGKHTRQAHAQSLEPLGEPTSVRQVFGLGAALPQNGIAVDAGTDSVHVAWSAGQKRATCSTRPSSSGMGLRPRSPGEGMCGWPVATRSCRRSPLAARRSWWSTRMRAR